MKQNPFPFSVRADVEEQVQAVLQLDFLERSVSAFNAPTLLGRKPDGTNRFSVDFRELNRNLVSDAEPIPRADCLLAEVGRRRYFSKLDMTKGYWQVPLPPTSKEMMTLSTPIGHYHSCYTPFGIKTAPAVFARLMRRLLYSVPNAYHYYDDFLVAAELMGGSP